MNEDEHLTFLIATDVHLGHSENSEHIGNDSYQAFEEVLEIAKQKNVDFLLLGGDLFDEINPTQKCMYKCLNLLKKNIFGDKQLNFGIQGMIPNFHNQNLNISLPVFTIHGNHDYPSNDFGKLSVCDLLHASNYVNYFGKKNQFTQKNKKTIVVTPLIFQNIKNHTNNSKAIRLAIYGIGYIKDLRFHKMLQDGQVIFEEPPQKQNTICILIIHQNRWKGKKGGVGPAYQNCIIPRQFPSWINLIIWCHEHEAITRIELEDNQRICQPGSTVITSYVEAESLKKQCVLVTIGKSVNQNQAQLHENLDVKTIPLIKSYRPMFIRSYSLNQIYNKYAVQNQTFDFQQYFDEVLQSINSEWISLNNIKKPIIRIKIDYTGHQIIRLNKIEDKFSKLIANPYKIFKYSHKTAKKKDNISQMNDQQILDMMRQNKIPQNHHQIDINGEIMQLFKQQFSKDNKFTVLNYEFMKDRIDELSKYDSRPAEIKKTYDYQIQKRCKTYQDDCIRWQQDQTKQFQKIKNKLISKKQDALNGSLQNFDQQNYKDMIKQHDRKYRKKQEQVRMFLDCQDKNSAIKGQRLGLNKKQNKKEQKKSNRQIRDSMLSQHEHRQNNESEQEDCCRRAQKAQYQQNVTVQNFKMVEFMIENKPDKNKTKKMKTDFL